MIEYLFQNFNVIRKFNVKIIETLKLQLLSFETSDKQLDFELESFSGLLQLAVEIRYWFVSAVG